MGLSFKQIVIDRFRTKPLIALTRFHIYHVIYLVLFLWHTSFKVVLWGKMILLEKREIWTDLFSFSGSFWTVEFGWGIKSITHFQYFLKSKFIYSLCIYITTANKFSCLAKPKKPHFTATKYSFLWQWKKRCEIYLKMKRVNGVLFSSWGF